MNFKTSFRIFLLVPLLALIIFLSIYGIVTGSSSELVVWNNNNYKFHDDVFHRYYEDYESKGIIRNDPDIIGTVRKVDNNVILININKTKSIDIEVTKQTMIFIGNRQSNAFNSSKIGYIHDVKVGKSIFVWSNIQGTKGHCDKVILIMN